MLKRLFVFVLLLLVPVFSSAQSLHLSYENSSKSNSANTFTLKGNRVKFSDNIIQFLASGKFAQGFKSYGVSPDKSTVGTLNLSETSVFNTAGDTLLSYVSDHYEQSDPSLNIYVFGDGRTVTRSNIARFAFYNPLGKEVANLSSSTGSRGGETISQMATDSRGKTIIVYNPKFIRNGNTGSQIRRYDNGEFQNIYYNKNRVIENLKISDNGQFISVLLTRAGADDEVVVMDQFGNVIKDMKFSEDLIGYQLTPDAHYLTVWSKGRVLTYSVLSGDKLGSTSFRNNPVVFADYMADDHVIIALTGNYSSSNELIRDINIKAVHVTKRKIANQDLGSSLGTNPKFNLDVKRKGTYRYQLTGVSKEVNIRAGF